MAKFFKTFNVPLYACESKSFKDFVGTLRPTYDPPNADRVEDILGIKTIVNIPYDCQERIFRFLNFKSFYAVANTCKQLQIATATRFRKRHAKKPVSLYPIAEDCNDRPIKGSFIYPDYVSMCGFKYCFLFLRSFGAALINLEVSYYECNDVQTARLDQYLNQYCADTLEELKIDNKTSFSVENFSKPFKNVKKLQIDCRNCFPNFINWFPNLRSLHFDCCTTSKTTNFAVHFPYLEHFTLKLTKDIHFKIKKNHRKFTREDATNFLRANKQLKSLNILGNELKLNDLFLEMISENTSIVKLAFTSDAKVDVSEIDLNRLASERPLLEELNLKNHTCSVDAAIMLTQKLGALKKLMIHVKDRIEYDRFLNQMDEKWQSKEASSSNNSVILIELRK